jgi:hypothetical protein
MSATPQIAEALMTRSSEGACVVVATASVRDAATLAPQLHVLARGTVARSLPAHEAEAMQGPQGLDARFVIVASDGRALLAELARESSLGAIETRGRSLVVRGNDAVEMARAIGRAAIRAKVGIESLERVQKSGEPPPRTPGPESKRASTRP